jgi:RNA polymerase sigma factor (sigma-70 family)
MMHSSAHSSNCPMPKDFDNTSFDSLLLEISPVVERVFVKAEFLRWNLPRQDFAAALRRSVEKRFQNLSPRAEEIKSYLESLHAPDLGLACACARGSEAAWEYFVATYRAELRAAARAILRASGSADETRADDLADSLIAELYGLRSDDAGERKSLFEYFHGRSKLSTWLHTILAQRQVDFLRSSSRTVALEEDSENGSPKELSTPRQADPPDPDRSMYLGRLDTTLGEALSMLSARERMILSCYYADGHTLAEIGRMIGEHESTISRQLDRTRRGLRETVTTILRRGTPAQHGAPAQPGLDEAQIEQAFSYALEDWPFDLSKALSKEQNGSPPE